MKKCTMLMALAAMMAVVPMVVSAHCGSCDSDTKKSAKKTCCTFKARKDAKKECTQKKCTRKECTRKECKCPKKAACIKEDCKEGCRCPKKTDAKSKK